MWWEDIHLQNQLRLGNSEKLNTHFPLVVNLFKLICFTDKTQQNVWRPETQLKGSVLIVKHKKKTESVTDEPDLHSRLQNPEFHAPNLVLFWVARWGKYTKTNLFGQWLWFSFTCMLVSQEAKSVRIHNRQMWLTSWKALANQRVFALVIGEVRLTAMTVWCLYPLLRWIN